MKYNPDIHHRRSIRLQAFDYSQAGAYFVTICTQGRKCLFGEIANKEMALNNAGHMVAFVWGQLPVRFDHVDLDAFVVMPNHIHTIFMLQRIHPISGRQVNQTHCGDESGVRPKGSLPGTVGRIVQAFKSITTHEYIIGVKQHGWPPFPGKLWQKNYYEHIIRNENELNQIREYITNNPMKWACDRENRTQ
jgi:REP element-mobilizing transposase RayT